MTTKKSEKSFENQSSENAQKTGEQLASVVASWGLWMLSLGGVRGMGRGSSDGA